MKLVRHLYKFHSLVLTNDQEGHLQNIVQPTITKHSLDIRLIKQCFTLVTQTLTMVCPFSFSSNAQVYSLVSVYGVLCFKRQVVLLLGMCSSYVLCTHLPFAACHDSSQDDISSSWHDISSKASNRDETVIYFVNGALTCSSPLVNAREVCDLIKSWNELFYFIF